MTPSPPDPSPEATTENNTADATGKAAGASGPAMSAEDRRWRAEGGFPWPPVIIVAVLMSLFTGIMLWRVYGPTNDGPAVLTDQAFVTRANGVCARRMPELRPKVLEKETQLPPPQAAEGARKSAAELDRLRGELAALPVAAGDRAAVSTWLDNWAGYIGKGRAYADELAANRVREAYQVSAEAQKDQLAADRFSRANGLPECVFATGQKLPKRTGM